VTGAPDTSLEALYLNLAVRLAPGYGKTPSPDTKSLASTAYKTLLGQSAQPVPMQIDNMAVPAGAGYKYWRGSMQPFLDPPQDNLDAGDDSGLDGITL
jgi:P22 tail accessory factor.